MVHDIDAPRDRGTQDARLELHLTTEGLGASTIGVPDRREPYSVGFRLGPLEGRAYLLATPDVRYGLDDGLTRTDWQLALVPDGAFTPADLLEALGASVVRDEPARRPRAVR